MRSRRWGRFGSLMISGEDAMCQHRVEADGYLSQQVSDGRKLTDDVIRRSRVGNPAIPVLFQQREGE